MPFNPLKISFASINQSTNQETLLTPPAPVRISVPETPGSHQWDQTERNTLLRKIARFKLMLFTPFLYVQTKYRTKKQLCIKRSLKRFFKTIAENRIHDAEFRLSFLPLELNIPSPHTRLWISGQCPPPVPPGSRIVIG